MDAELIIILVIALLVFDLIKKQKKKKRLMPKEKRNNSELVRCARWQKHKSSSASDKLILGMDNDTCILSSLRHATASQITSTNIDVRVEIGQGQKMRAPVRTSKKASRGRVWVVSKIKHSEYYIPQPA